MLALDDDAHVSITWRVVVRRSYETRLGSSNYHAFLTFLGGRLAGRGARPNHLHYREKITQDSDYPWRHWATTRRIAKKEPAGLDDEPPHKHGLEEKGLVTRLSTCARSRGPAPVYGCDRHRFI